MKVKFLSYITWSNQVFNKGDIKELPDEVALHFIAVKKAKKYEEEVILEDKTKGKIKKKEV